MTDETVVAAAALKEAMSQESTDDVMAAVAVRYVEAGLAQTFEARQSSALADKARAIDARFLEALEKVQLAATSDDPKTVLDELIEKNPALLDALKKTDSAPDSPSGDWFQAGIGLMTPNPGLSSGASPSLLPSLLRMSICRMHTRINTPQKRMSMQWSVRAKWQCYRHRAVPENPS